MRADVPCKVDVEVVRHAYTRQDSHASIGEPLRTARTFIRHLRHPSEGTPKGAEQDGKGIELGASPAGAESQKEPVTIGVPTEEAATLTQAGYKPSDEEGWVSEDSGNGTISSSSAAQAPAGRRKRVRSSKAKVVVKPAGAGLNKRGRRRSSASEHGRSSPHVRSTYSDLGSDTTPTLSPTANVQGRIQDMPEDADQRGRSPDHERKGSAHSSHPSIRHRRLESLRLTRHSRDASPARSIRFADENRSGTSTPRNGVLQNESCLPSNQVDDSPLDEDAESARGRVTFELPAKH